MLFEKIFSNFILLPDEKCLCTEQYLSPQVQRSQGGIFAKEEPEDGQTDHDQGYTQKYESEQRVANAYQQDSGDQRGNCGYREG